ncbi:MAG: class I SAM-dependent methyltransferase, partial [Acidimicrobiia bacterium]
ALADAGARVVATDLSADMLAWEAKARPPCAVADIRFLPLAAAAVDDTVAAFVLNHLPDPAAGLAELRRVTRPGGAILVNVYSNASQSEVRDRIDEVAAEAGWQVPDWYRGLKYVSAPLLGTAEAMEAVAAGRELVDVVVEERPVDVGITEPDRLVRYRFGQAQFAAWLDGIGPERADEIRRRAADAIAPIMEPFRPIVVFLAARRP